MKAFKNGIIFSEAIPSYDQAVSHFLTSYTASLMDFVHHCWPDVIQRKGCYLLSDVDILTLTEVMVIMGDSKSSVETQLNRRKLTEMLPANAPVSPAELIELGKMMQGMWKAKLKQQYPTQNFSVIFTHGKWGDDVENFELTFFQNNYSNQ